MVEHDKEMELQDFVFGLFVLDRFNTHASCQVFLGLFFFHSDPNHACTSCLVVQACLLRGLGARLGMELLLSFCFSKPHRRKSGNYSL